MIDFSEYVRLDPRNSRDEHLVTEESLSKRCMAMLPPDLVKGKSILDIGCALGAMGHWVLSNGATYYTGVEVQPEYVDGARNLLKMHHNYWDVVESLDDVYSKYDIVIASGVIHGMFDPYTFIRQICDKSKEHVIVESVYNVNEEPYPAIKLVPLRMIKYSSPMDPYVGLSSYPNKKAIDMLFGVNGFEVDIDRIYPERILNSHDPYNGGQGKDRFISRYKAGIKIRTLEDEINVGIQQRRS